MKKLGKLWYSMQTSFSLLASLLCDRREVQNRDSGSHCRIKDIPWAWENLADSLYSSFSFLARSLGGL